MALHVTQEYTANWALHWTRHRTFPLAASSESVTVERDPAVRRLGEDACNEILSDKIYYGKELLYIASTVTSHKWRARLGRRARRVLRSPPFRADAGCRFALC